MAKPIVDIYTDGACLGNPGPGGWAAILVSGPHQKEISGGEENTTNQRMEMTAAIKALEALKRPSVVTIHSDSSYLINAFLQNWLERWQRNGWMTSKKMPVENKDLWERLLKLANIHDVLWRKVKGHSGHEENERCDKLAKEAAQAVSNR